MDNANSTFIFHTWPAKRNESQGPQYTSEAKEMIRDEGATQLTPSESKMLMMRGPQKDADDSGSSYLKL